MSTPLQRELAAETFAEVDRLVRHTVESFLRQDRLRVPEGPALEQRRQDYWSVAQEAYCRAYHSYDPRAGTKFSTWVGYVVWKALLSERRKEARYCNTVKQTLLPEQAPAPCFDVEEFLRGLSDDARLVAEVALTAPLDLRLVHSQQGRRADSTEPRGARRALFQLLRELGWNMRRIAASFREIREALS